MGHLCRRILVAVLILVVFCSKNRTLAQTSHGSPAKSATDVSPKDSRWIADWRALTNQYCRDCHQGEGAEAELDFAKLDEDLSDLETHRRWVQVFDRVTRGEMPPPEAERIPDKRRATALQRLRDSLQAAEADRRDVVLRRLNRTEYENTVRDLFAVDVRVKDLLPQDNATNGFDTVGEGLAVSAEATQAYLRAADVVLDAVFGPPKPPKVIRHETNLLDQKTHDGKPYLDNQIGKMFRRTDDGLVIFQSGYCPTNLVNFARLRAPAGTYRGTMRVRAIQSDKPVVLRIYGGDTIVGRREKHLVGYFDVPPGKWTTITFEDQLVEPNGTFQPKCYGTKDTRQNADSYPEPGIEIGDITIEGPLEPWPPISRQKLLQGIDPTGATADDADQILSNVIRRAFRRDVSAEEIEPYLALVRDSLATGRDFQAALRLSLKAVLCSPEFLYLDEPLRPLDEASNSSKNSIDSFALASRLSYFLWSSMPDERLFSLAGSGQLHDKEVLRGEVERLLADERSEAFVRNFVGQWLNLRDLDFTIPDANLYPDYDELLRVSMEEETHRFFREVLDKDLSLLNFIDSDFTFLNQRLAEHYGIDGVSGQQLRKVSLPEQSVRGGLMTQASVLKVTANGTTTSPVTRGVWVYEKLQGLAVPPPPSNVSAVEPDIRGATTLREQLAKHRNSDACITCHRRIDPAGFALENFDVIGGWREEYRTLGEGRRPDFSRDPHSYAWIRYRLGRPVDATGVTFDGRAFTDIRDFKRLLVAERDSITRGLVRNVATYGSGRSMGFSDRPQLNQITERVAAQSYGFRTLIHEVVQSDLFRSP